MVNFLLLAEKVDKFTKKDIDQGNTPPNMYAICCCTREAFCLSYAIRKDNNLFIYYIEDRIAIKLIGRELRFMGSDVRSQVLLILRALNKIKQNAKDVSKDWKKSTPGIYGKMFESDAFFYDFLNTFNTQSFAFIAFEPQPSEFLACVDIKEFDFAGNIQDYFYILSLFEACEKKPDFIVSLKTNERIKFFTISNIKTVRDRILWINYQIDQRSTNRNEVQP